MSRRAMSSRTFAVRSMARSNRATSDRSCSVPGPNASYRHALSSPTFDSRRLRHSTASAAVRRSSQYTSPRVKGPRMSTCWATKLSASAAATRCNALALTAGAFPPCIEHTRPPMIAARRHRSPLRLLFALHCRDSSMTSPSDVGGQGTLHLRDEAVAPRLQARGPRQKVRRPRRTPDRLLSGRQAEGLHTAIQLGNVHHLGKVRLDALPALERCPGDRQLMLQACGSGLEAPDFLVVLEAVHRDVDRVTDLVVISHPWPPVATPGHLR